MHESYKLSAINDILPSVNNSYVYKDIVKAANYFDARYSEMSANSYLTTAMDSIYDPYKF